MNIDTTLRYFYLQFLLFFNLKSQHYSAYPQQTMQIIYIVKTEVFCNRHHKSLQSFIFIIIIIHFIGSACRFCFYLSNISTLSKHPQISQQLPETSRQTLSAVQTPQTQDPQILLMEFSPFYIFIFPFYPSYAFTLEVLYFPLLSFFPVSISFYKLRSF